MVTRPIFTDRRSMSRRDIEMLADLLDADAAILDDRPVTQTHVKLAADVLRAAAALGFPVGILAVPCRDEALPQASRASHSS